MIQIGYTYIISVQEVPKVGELFYMLLKSVYYLEKSNFRYFSEVSITLVGISYLIHISIERVIIKWYLYGVSESIDKPMNIAARHCSVYLIL